MYSRIAIMLAIVVFFAVVGIYAKHNGTMEQESSANSQSRNGNSMSYVETLYSNINTGMLRGGVCEVIRQKVDQIYYSGTPDNIKVQMIERMGQKAMETGCLR